MAFSGTISQTKFNARKVIDAAFTACKMPLSTVSGEHIQIARDQLYLLLSDLPNKGLLLWTIEKQLYPIQAGVQRLQLEHGTIDLLDTNLRLMSPVEYVSIDTPTSRELILDGPAALDTLAVEWFGDPAPFTVERLPEGSAVWEPLMSVPEKPGHKAWYELPNTSRVDRIRINVETPSLLLQDVTLAYNSNEIPLSRMNRNDWAAIGTRGAPSERPVQYYVDRGAAHVDMYLWPTPNEHSVDNAIATWRKRYIMDVGSMQDDVEVPQRWLQALTSLLAVRLALNIAQIDDSRIPLLTQVAAEDSRLAQSDEFDNSPMRILPNISAYTA